MVPVETIVAIATAHGRAGIGVVRVSGPSTSAIARQICGLALMPRHARLASFKAADGRSIDQGIALFFEAPHSYTGEDVLELQGHGGAAVLRMVMQRCIELGARPAEPGEFTRRAFLNDKIDLVQAESVADLINASSSAAARSAMRSLDGAFSSQIHQIADDLLEIRVLVEAVLDFPEEETNALGRANVSARLAEMRDHLSKLIDEGRQGRLLRDGTRAVLIGRPNVGKSSLMNQLAREEVAIVTDIPGTTRDALRYELVVAGVPIHVVDTAGLREGGDTVERLGIARTVDELAKADIALVVLEATANALDSALPIPAEVSGNFRKLIIINKIDLFDAPAKMLRQDDQITVWASAKTGQGVELIRAALLELAGWDQLEEAPFMANERQLMALQDASVALARALTQTAALELLAEELRGAHRALGRLTGEVSADDLLGEIFSRFCIGK